MARKARVITMFRSQLAVLAKEWIQKIILIMVIGAITVSPIQAQDNTIRIAATVNDDAISELDVLARARILLLGNSTPETPENLEKVANQALQSLIEESLKLQEAKRLKINISQEEINQEIEKIAASNNTSSSDFLGILRGAGVPEKSYLRQIKAGLAWRSVIRRMFGSQIVITAQEVDAILAERSRFQEREEVYLLQIFLPVSSSGQLAPAQSLGQRLLQALERGSDFAALARAYSKDLSAQQGGDLGWVHLDTVPAVLQDAVRKLKPGRVSSLISTPAGVYILGVRDRRIKAAENNNIEVNIKQILVPIPTNANPASQARALQIAQRAYRQVENCDDISRVQTVLGLSDQSQIGRMNQSELPPGIRDVIAQLPINHPSRPLRLRSGYAVLLVCDRDDLSSPNTDRETIESELLNKRLIKLANHYLTDLQRQAVVDIRI